MRGFLLFIVRLFFYPYKSFLFQLIKILRFFPGRLNLYELSVIHKSAAMTDSEGNPLNNERLEYLGDAVLGMVIAEQLFLKYPEKDEGFLTKMRSRIVNGEHLSHLAKQLNLNKLLVNKVNNKQANKHLLGDALEAFIGAIYLDRGYVQTRQFIKRRVIRPFVDFDELEHSETNYKSLLIEWAQQFKKEVTFYTDQEPYDPNKFISFVSIGDTLFGNGSGISKKEAEQLAAMETLKELKVTTHG